MGRGSAAPDRQAQAAPAGLQAQAIAQAFADAGGMALQGGGIGRGQQLGRGLAPELQPAVEVVGTDVRPGPVRRDRKSTRLNSSHVKISYAVFCLKKKY